MLKLEKHYQQIILSCKGKSELYKNNLLSKEKSVYNTIANIIDMPLCELEDYAVYYWLFQTIKLLDINSEKNILNNIIENMFADDNKISMRGMILKFISAIR